MINGSVSVLQWWLVILYTSDKMAKYYMCT